MLASLQRGACMQRVWVYHIVVCVLIGSMNGCATKTQTGALAGGALGAGSGAAIGAAMGGKEGALVGGALGTILGTSAGAAIGKYFDDKQERTRDQTVQT